MQIFQQLIESLKMELGLIKVNTIQELSFSAQIQELPVSISVNDQQTSICCLIQQTGSVFGDLKVNSLEQNQPSLQIHSLDCTSKITVSEGTIHPKIPSAQILYHRDTFGQKIRTEAFCLNGVVLQDRLVKVSVREKNLPVLKIMKFAPSPFPKTEVALRALEDFLMNCKQRPETLNFVGYYRSVPIDSAKRYLIMDRDLVVELSQKRSRRVDLFVFKSMNQYLFQIVSRK